MLALFAALVCGSSLSCRTDEPTASMTAEQSAAVTLSNADVTLTFSHDGRSAFWSQYRDNRAGIDLIDGSSVFLRVAFGAPPERFLFNHSAWDSVRFERRGADQLDIVLVSREIGTVTASVGLTGPSVSWEMKLDRSGSLAPIREIAYPLIEAAPLNGDSSDDDTFYPQRSGVLVRDVLGSSTQLPRGEADDGTMPSGITTLGLMGHYDRTAGFTLHSEDLTFHKKKLKVTPVHYPDGHGRTIFAVEWPSPVAAPGAAAFPAPTPSGKQVTTLLHGDWYDASQRYRDRMRELAPERFARAISPKLSDVSLWISDACDPGAPCIDAIAQIASELGHPLGFHWYVWHQIPFDTDYPGFFPPKPGFAEAVSSLEARNVTVMPYINAHLWDTRRDDYQSSDALLLPSGEPYLFGQLARMCPTSTRFQARLGDVTNTLFQTYHVDGVYLDQLAAVWPMDCHNPTHEHPRDTSDWWTARGTHTLLDQLDASRPSQGYFTSEWVNEAFVGRLDGMLTNYFALSDQIPLFNAVYNDATRTFGRFHWRGPASAKAYRMKIGQSLVYGNQLGWLDLAAIAEGDSRSLSIGLAKLRSQYRAFFDGAMMRPPRIVTSRTVRADWNFYWTETFIELPVVLAGRFSDQHGTISVFVNIDEHPRTLDCDVQEASLDFDTNVGSAVERQRTTGSVISLQPGQAAIFARSIDGCTVVGDP